MKQLLFLILAGGLIGCGQSSDNYTSSNRLSGIQTYAERGVDTTWPDLGEGSTSYTEDITSNNYYLIIDGSGSMNESGCSNGQKKMDVAKTALANFISELPAAANFGIYVFDINGIGERLPLGNHDKTIAIKSLNKIEAGGGTPLSASVEWGIEALTNKARSQFGYGEYHLVIVTDGQASRGYDPVDQVDILLTETAIVLHTIGFCIDDRHALNRPGYTIYKAANDPQALSSGLKSVLAESPDFQLDSFAGDNE